MPCGATGGGLGDVAEGSTRGAGQARVIERVHRRAVAGRDHFLRLGRRAGCRNDTPGDSSLFLGEVGLAQPVSECPALLRSRRLQSESGEDCRFAVAQIFES